MSHLVERATFHIALTALLARFSASADAQQSVAMRSYAEARAVLDRGIGGGRRSRGVARSGEHPGRFRGRGLRPQPERSSRGAVRPEHAQGKLPAGQQAQRRTVPSRVPVSRHDPVRNLILIRGDTAVAMDLIQRVAAAAPGNSDDRGEPVADAALPAAPGAGPGSYAPIARAGPTLDGKPQNVIAFAAANGAQLTVYFDAGTGLPTALEALNPDLVTGEAPTPLALLRVDERGHAQGAGAAGVLDRGRDDRVDRLPQRAGKPAAARQPVRVAGGRAGPDRQHPPVRQGGDWVRACGCCRRSPTATTCSPWRSRIT